MFYDTETTKIEHKNFPNRPLALTDDILRDRDSYETAQRASLHRVVALE